MGIVFRQSVKTSLVLVVGSLLGGVILWLSTKFVPKQQFGFINSFTRWALIASAFVPLGLISTLAVYIHKYANESRKKKMLITICFIVPTIVTILVSIIYLLVPAWLLRHFQVEDRGLMQRYYGWLPIYILLFFYLAILEQYLASRMKVAVTAFLKEVVLRLLNIILILLFGYGLINFSGLFIGTILLYLVPIATYFLLSFRTKEFGFLFKADLFTRNEYIELAHFTWYHFLLSISLSVMTLMDVMLLPFYDHEGFAAVAVYVVATYIITLATIPYKAFTPSTYTVMAKAFAENDVSKANDIFVRSSINLLTASLGIAIVLFCNLQNMADIIGNGKNYMGIIPVFTILIVGQLVNFATGINDQVLSITNYYKFNFYLSISLIILFFILIKVLVPRYGIYGAALSNAIIYIVFNTWKCIFIWKRMGMQPFSNKTILILMAGLPALAAGYFFPYLFEPEHHIYLHTFIDAAIRSSLVFIVYLAMLLWLKPSADLEVYVASIRKNKRLF